MDTVPINACLCFYIYIYIYIDGIMFFFPNELKPCKPNTTKQLSSKTLESKVPK
jgi:hypothetical protein